ncbi:MAG: RNA polymerase subunit sigma-24, partial [Spirochaetes bacterium]|nr:RNA polymerase subunit sigma-24 [Spirochaetota bacterium]
MGEGKQAPNTDAEDLLAVSEVLRGNVDAFRVIVDHYRGLVFRLALSSLGSREEAEEAAQEVFLRAFRSLRSFHLGNRFLPWL